jgi:hypothetical protein
MLGENKRLIKDLAIVIAIASVFSLFTLWLIDSWIKYPLFLFEVFTIVILYLAASDFEISVIVKYTFRMGPNWGLVIDVLLVSSSIALLYLAALPLDVDLIRAILALLCTSLLPGYALLNISGLGRYFSKLEGLLFSYILSYIFTGLAVLILLPIDEGLRGTAILLSYIGLGIASAFKHWRQPPTFRQDSLTRRIDILALLLSTTFYALSFYFIYPGFALLPGSDISRHYASSIILNRSPDIYVGSVYQFSHLHEYSFISLSNSSLTTAQTALATLNLMLPLAFYSMAKAYLEKIDARLPSLATLFWVLFTNSFGGFAWLYFVTLKLSSTGQSQLQLLSSVADKTFNGVVYGIFGLWYVPATISFILLMAAIFLICNKELESKRYFTLFSVLIAALFLTHVTEAIVYIQIGRAHV